MSDLVKCSQCGQLDEPQIIFFDKFLGLVCRNCAKEINEFNKPKSSGGLSPALQKAHEVRRINAEAKNKLKDELKQARIERNPELYQKRLEALKRAREIRFGKKELVHAADEGS